MDRESREAIEEKLGTAIRSLRALSGGDINEAHAVTLEDGRTCFVKTNRRAPPGMFPAEARGLTWLGETRALRVPSVIAADDRWLILELVQPGSPSPSFDEDLGRGLAAIHRAGAPTFGLDHDNFIGRLPQSNQAAQRWIDFYRDQRLEPQVRLATDAGLMPPALRRSFTRLFTVLPERVGPPEPPARLHGDLWGGNVMCDDRGGPCLIDPATYGGHREVDLAMMRLFGGFRARTFDAYTESYPLAAGHAERVRLYQIYPLLVHVNLFGGSYVESVSAAVASQI